MEHYFHSLYNAIYEFAPRLHWAKYLCNISSHEVQSMYPSFSDFVRIREEMDPHDIFINDALRQLFN
ncbi:D-arabinono-1,4-lactone oxidase [Methylobacterium crusticola]|uniref:D-arabinono-1,4-lactone oxidase n=1 Tax=Methylobacterium crusticola TaxID=1697972 RepID=UPI0034D4C843